MRFTVLTPTYNRAHLLPRAFESLRAQTFGDFEWLIIDDGSNDGTAELVASWSADFPIRYYWQPNRGKHAAMNFGLGLLAGELICQLDSDDQCAPRALELFDLHWRHIPNPQGFAAVSGLCLDGDGKVVGPLYPSSPFDAMNLKQLALVGNAERWSAIRSDVWKQYRFPEFPGERYIAEGSVWARMLSRYAVRCVNEPVRIYTPQPGGITATDWREHNPRGAFFYYRQLSMLPAPFFTRIKAAVNAARFMPSAAYARLFRH